MKVGLIGFGNLGNYLLRKVNVDKCIPGARIETVLVRRKVNIKDVEVCDSIDQFLESDIDIVIETATIEAVKTFAPEILTAGKDLIIISVGAFVDQRFENQIRSLAKKHQANVYLPSGAIGGLDVIQAAKNAGQLDAVKITTKKPALSLIDKKITQEEILYKGNARDAIQLFPKNANVSIILSLAGLGVEKTTVEIVADPFIAKNQHSIEARGGFGQMKINLENEPMPENPKTSYLTALSLLSALKDRNQTINIV